MFCAFVIYFNWETQAGATYGEEQTKLIHLESLVEKIANIDPHANSERLKKLEAYGNVLDTLNRWTSWLAIILGFFSVGLMIWGVYTAAALFQYFPSP